MNKFSYTNLFIGSIKTQIFMNPNGVVTVSSPFSVKESIDRLQAFLIQHGATIYARINQEAEVKKAGQNLFPLEFILFGNPKAGGPVMAENPLAALELPLKVLAWEDREKKVWLAYNEALYIEERYSLPHLLTAPLNLDNMISSVLKG